MQPSFGEIMDDAPLPTFADVEDAAARLEGVAVRTPLIRNDALDAAAGGQVYVKAENLQRTGSFKFRGAYNRLSRLTPDERMTGVVAFSSGNHAQGVAAAAALVGVEAAIVMPSDAPKAKIEGARALGGQVVLYDRQTESREEIAARIAEERGAVLVPAFEDFHVIAGQGTLGLEAIQQIRALETEPAYLVAPVSGGGMIGGVGLAFGALSPETRLFAVEPAAYDDHAQSLAQGHPVEVKPPTPTLADGLMAPRPGDLTFALNKDRLTGALAVSDEEMLDAMAFAFRHLKLVLEPSGAAALAAVLSGRIGLAGETIIVVASGGNVDPEVFGQALARL
jgi:threonine dehydratase